MADTNKKSNRIMGPTDEAGKIDFVGKIGLFGGISGIAVILSLVLIFTKGFDYGIDFVGGTEMEVKFLSSVGMDQVREIVEKAGVENSSIQGFAGGTEFMLRFQVAKGATDKDTNQNLVKGIAKVKEDLIKTFAAQNPEFRRVDTVGPQVGAELKRHALLAAFYCFLVILIYVGLRFDYKFAPGAVLCLVHDAIVTLGIFCLLGKEVNVQIMAAILTLIGYSLNDTIVVYDRIRETTHTFREKGMTFIVNRAVNDMLQRTILTSLLTFLSALALYLFGKGVIVDLAFAFGIGIIVGTYSSIYVASPLVIWLERVVKKA